MGKGELVFWIKSWHFKPTSIECCIGILVSWYLAMQTDAANLFIFSPWQQIAKSLQREILAVVRLLSAYPLHLLAKMHGKWVSIFFQHILTDDKVLAIFMQVFKHENSIFTTDININKCVCTRFCFCKVWAGFQPPSYFVVLVLCQFWRLMMKKFNIDYETVMGFIPKYFSPKRFGRKCSV